MRVTIFETPNLWVNKWIQRPKFNDFVECMNQNINMAVTWCVLGGIRKREKSDTQALLGRMDSIPRTMESHR